MVLNQTKLCNKYTHTVLNQTMKVHRNKMLRELGQILQPTGHDITPDCRSDYLCSLLISGNETFNIEINDKILDITKVLASILPGNSIPPSTPSPLPPQTQVPLVYSS